MNSKIDLYDICSWLELKGVESFLIQLSRWSVSKPIKNRRQPARWKVKPDQFQVDRDRKQWIVLLSNGVKVVLVLNNIFKKKKLVKHHISNNIQNQCGICDRWWTASFFLWRYKRWLLFLFYIEFIIEWYKKNSNFKVESVSINLEKKWYYSRTQLSSTSITRNKKDITYLLFSLTKGQKSPFFDAILKYVQLYRTW